MKTNGLVIGSPAFQISANGVNTPSTKVGRDWVLKYKIKLGAGQEQALFESLTAQKSLLESISRTIADLAGSDESQSPQSLQYRPKVIVGQFL